LEQKAFVSDKKGFFFDLMIDNAGEEYQIDRRKKAPLE
jgi:hypothetical protein